MWFSIECSSKIPGVSDEVRKQFKEMILNEKDLAPACDMQPATASSDESSGNVTNYLPLL